MRALEHPVLGRLDVVPIEPARAYALRQMVLRPHQREPQMGEIDSADPRALVVGALGSHGEVYGTGAIAPGAPPPGVPPPGVPPPGVDAAALGWRLRGMATAPDAARAGVGAAVLAALVEHASRYGATVVWCNARVPAVGFYERAGFAVCGEPWEEPEIGPHVVMWRQLTPDRAARAT